MDIHLRGVGWGRLVIRTQVPTTVNITVSHSEIDLENPTGPAQGKYDERNHTQVYFFPDGGAPTEPNSFLFEWLGLPRNASRGFVGAARGSLEVTPENPGVIVVATSVQGYRIELQAGVASSFLSRDWKLAPHEGYAFEVPTPSITAAVDDDLARVSVVRDWTTGSLDLNPSLLIAFQWTISGPDSFSAGVIRNELAIREQRPADDPRRGLSIDAPNTPIVSVSGGSFFLRRIVAEPTTLEMYRHLEVTTVGPDTQIYGASFLSIPLYP